MGYRTGVLRVRQRGYSLSPSFTFNFRRLLGAPPLWNSKLFRNQKIHHRRMFLSHRRHTRCQLPAATTSRNRAQKIQHFRQGFEPGGVGPIIALAP